MKNKFYDEAFYKMQAEESYQSAKAVNKFFNDQIFSPTSVIDIGAGVGTWLKAWQDLGVKNIQGIDGNEMDEKYLYIPRDKLRIDDLDKIAPNKTGKKYDLAMSLEVAEHLKPESSENFVQVLTSYSDIVMFSAALPLQDGTNHINCRPVKFWADLFADNGYACFDIIRPHFLSRGGEYNGVVYAKYIDIRQKGGGIRHNKARIFADKRAGSVLSRFHHILVFSQQTDKKMEMAGAAGLDNPCEILAQKIKEII